VDHTEVEGEGCMYWDSSGSECNKTAEFCEHGTNWIIVNF